MPAERVFEIDEESAAGGTSYCWVEKHRDGFHLFGGELGHMWGPCGSVADAVTSCGFQFGMGYMTIQCSITVEELREILESPAFLLDNVEVLTLNAERVEDTSVDAIIAAYTRQA